MPARRGEGSGPVPPPVPREENKAILGVDPITDEVKEKVSMLALINDQRARALPGLLEKVNHEENEDVVAVMLDSLNAGVITAEDFEPYVEQLFDVGHNVFYGWSEPLEDLFAYIDQNEKISHVIENYVREQAEQYSASDGERVLHLFSILPRSQFETFVQKDSDAVTKIKQWFDQCRDFNSWETRIFEDSFQYIEKDKRLDLLSFIILIVAREFTSPGTLTDIAPYCCLEQSELKELFEKLFANHRELTNGLIEIAHIFIKDFNPDAEPDEPDENDEEGTEAQRMEAMSLYGKEVRQFLSQPDAKVRICKDVKKLEQLPDSQAWISVHPPEDARKVYAFAQERLAEKEKNAFSTIVAKYTGMKKVTDDTFLYYPDELMDAVVEYVERIPRLCEDKAWKTLSAETGLEGEKSTSVRFIRRTTSDLRLGDKCGDCTAQGSGNYQNSLSWYINPLYQILIMKEAGQFMGKMCLTIGTVKDDSALFIDALEFHPQAREDGPYNERAKRAFSDALAFVKNLAEKEKMKLYALVRSNSSGANAILMEEGVPLDSEVIQRSESKKAEGTPHTRFSVRLSVPQPTIDFIDKNDGKIWYQMFEEKAAKEGGDVTFREKKADPIDQKLYILERDVINPAQMNDTHIAEAMRGRDFKRAARLIMAHKDWAPKVNDFFGFPGSYGNVSPILLSEKIGLMFKSEGEGVEQLKAVVILYAQNFVRLSSNAK